jgi:GntR family transcriptional regulator
MFFPPPFRWIRGCFSPHALPGAAKPLGEDGCSLRYALLTVHQLNFLTKLLTSNNLVVRRQTIGGPVKQLKANKMPLSLQVQHHILDLIKDDTFSPGDRLPSEAEFSMNLGVSRPTLREALKSLEQEGVLLRKHGVGTFISSHTPFLESGLEVLESLECQAKRSGIKLEVVDQTVLERPATLEELDMLALPVDKPIDILSVDRVIAVKGRPVAHLKDAVPLTYLCKKDLDNQFSSSVLDILLKRDAPSPALSRAEIEAVKAGTNEASRLGISEGEALLKLTGQLYNRDEEVLDYSVSYFVPGFFKFHLMRKVPNG